MKEIKVESRYHGTTATVRPHKDERGYYITRTQASRLLHRLCPLSGCMCGGVFVSRTRDQEALHQAMLDIFASYRDTGYLTCY